MARKMRHRGFFSFSFCLCHATFLVLKVTLWWHSPCTEATVKDLKITKLSDTEAWSDFPFQFSSMRTPHRVHSFLWTHQSPSHLGQQEALSSSAKGKLHLVQCVEACEGEGKGGESLVLAANVEFDGCRGRLNYLQAQDSTVMLG